MDFLRGIALIMIFIDHVPGNLLASFTLRNFGFSDAAELFVLLAGFSSMMAYGGAFARDGAVVGLRRVLARVARLYLFQAVLLLLVLVGVSAWIHNFHVVPDSGAPYVHTGLNGLRHGLTLQALPASLNILPLYIVLLVLFPLIYALIRISPVLAALVSGGVWLWVNYDPDFNLTNWLDGQGWYFNPFAWQFLFTIGALGAVLMRRNGGSLPHAWWVRLPAVLCLGFAALAAAPWVTWGWLDWHPIVLNAPDKTVLAPLRLMNILALVTLALGSEWFRRVAEHKALFFVVACGKHSLEVFSLATLLSIASRLSFLTFGVNIVTQLLADGLGLGLMIVLALILERWRHPASAAPRPVRATENLIPVSLE
ncbi:MAG TPA: OpgC domain-containing protein [Acetobacteraceae bacterium]|nr:OpgC domain-containing protein [Acetobacteraceae bacterium]